MKSATLAKIIKYIPFNDFRVFMYKTFFDYEIGKNVKIGRSFILCDSVKILENSTIGDRTFISCKKLLVGANTKINSGNTIMGKAEFSIGDNSRIINDHFFDLTNTIRIGDNSWIAGKASQFWTHGSIHTKEGNKDMSISIKDNVYIGSNVSFAPGVKIENSNLIGLGSVVHYSINNSNNIVVGNPAKIIKQNIDWRENW
jgi:acetyltransferase-like isoleucine patch superfamily enzyme